MKNGKTHILQVVHSLIIGGTERVVCDLVRSFNDERFTTSVCCLDELGGFGEDLLKDGYEVDVLGRQPGVDGGLVNRMKRLYREREVDIVHAHQYTPYFYAASASLIGQRKPVIFTEHGRHYPDHLRPKRALFNQVLRTVTTAYTGVSEFTRRSLVSFEKMPASRISVIYNGIWSANQPQHSEERETIRTSMGLQEDDLLVLSIGRMDPIKDFETLIRGFVPVAEEFPTARIWIAGGGDPGYGRKLGELISSLDLQGRVTLLGSRRDVPQLLAACDVFVLPSITEAASMTILEAMSARRAVVTTRTGGNPELVQEGITGLLFGVKDTADLSRNLSNILGNHALRTAMGEAGHRRVRDIFSMNRTLDQYRRLYMQAGSN